MPRCFPFPDENEDPSHQETLDYPGPGFSFPPGMFSSPAIFSAG